MKNVARLQRVIALLVLNSTVVLSDLAFFDICDRFPCLFHSKLPQSGRNILKRYRQGKECARMNLNNQQDDAWSPNEVSQFINK